MKETVGVFQCKTYNINEVKKNLSVFLDRIIEDKIINCPCRILLKVNLLKDASPYEAITTHPVVVRAVVEYFQALKCNITIADCPGAPLGFSVSTLDRVYEATGMKDVSDETGCELNYDVSKETVKNINGVVLNNISIASYIKNADYVITLGKLKTHTMMGYTGAVKNLFGVVPGRKKMKYHFSMKSVDEFSNLVLDICEYVKPVLSIIDGIEGMEGNGPSAGEKKTAGIILAGTNPHLLDYITTRLVGIDYMKVGTLRNAWNRKLITEEMINTTLYLGDPIDRINISPFKLPVISDQYAKPVILIEKCKGCGVCASVCPAQTINMKNNKPMINLEKCIRCFCCHELCPEKAVNIERFIY